MRHYRANEATRIRKATAVALVAVLAALAAWAGAADTDAAKRTGAIQNPEEYIAGYTIETKRIDYLADPAEVSERKHLFVTPSARINDRLAQPTWKAPHKVVDVRQDYPLVQGTMNRALFSPEIFRKGFMRNSEPHLIGRNSIPLREVEQIVVDIPDSYERQRSKIDMIGHTFGRGSVDFFCGWLEIPRNIAIEMRAHDPRTGCCIGLAKGVMWTFVRTLSGAKDLVIGTADMVRFPFHDPEKLDHRAWLKPEWIIQDIWGDPIPFVCETRGPRAYSRLTPKH